MNRRIRKFLLILGAAGLGGLINAALCYFKIFYTGDDFPWHIIPMGALHGLILALIPVVWLRFIPSKGPGFLVLGFVVTGYLGGWLSWLPLKISITSDPFSKALGEWLSFPVKTAPHEFFEMFGLVSALFYLSYHLLNWNQEKRYEKVLPATVVSGVAGSLWFWISVGDNWLLSPLHGSIWGILVGLALVRANRRKK